MSERLDSQVWMKPEPMRHLTPSTFSGYSWPAAAVGTEAAALVGAWLNQAPSEVEWDAAQLLCFSILAGETPSHCNYLLLWGRSCMAGHLSRGGCGGRAPPGRMASSAAPWQAGPAICTALGPLHAGHRCQWQQQQQRGFQPAWEPTWLPESPSSWTWVEITPWLKCNLASRLQLNILIPADIVPCGKKKMWRTFSPGHYMFC